MRMGRKVMTKAMDKGTSLMEKKEKQLVRK